MSILATTTAPPESECGLLDFPCKLNEGIGDIVSVAANDALQQFVNNIMEGYGKALASLGTLWVRVPSPVTVVDQGGGVNGGGTPPQPEAFETILGYVTWVSAGLAVMSLIIAGVMMASRRRHGDGEAHMGRIGVIIMAVLLLSSASALVTGFLPLAMHLNESSSVVGWVQGQLQWYTGGIAILSILVAAGRMVWTQRAMPLRELAGSVLTLIAVAGAGLVVIRLATSAGDAFSVWILDNSTDCSVTNGESNCFGTTVGAMIGMTMASQNSIGLIGLFLLGMLAVFMTYVQIALMVFRGAMLVVLAGIFPIAAAATNTEIGRQWFKKAMAWTLAFILYKPAAAIVYAIAFRMTGTDLFKSDGTGLFQIVTGLALMLIALIALPALMRFLVPAVSSVGGGGAAGLVLGAAALSAAGDIATGAIRASNNGGGGGGNGGGGGGGNSSSTDGPSGSTSTPGSPASTSAADPSGSAATAGSGAGAGAGSAATSGAGAAASSGAGAGAAASGAAAAAGPIGAGIAVATKAAEGAKHAAQAVKAGTEEATGSNESGS
ncbi:hypothetical protein MT356_20425 [Rathayibacter festucae]|uniref:hypothetical protein n=1 Tax=Rathayibacter festucae TaxID=110937 RepID=UPI001FB203AE|nr:hypothetical protein [Rathayibacter festucae]MCJ1702083.1 hypothetical protein [Rathayibacter festucae]